MNHYIVTLKERAKIPGDRMNDTEYYCQGLTAREVREIYALEMGCMPEDFNVRRAAE